MVYRPGPEALGGWWRADSEPVVRFVGAENHHDDGHAGGRPAAPTPLLIVPVMPAPETRRPPLPAAGPPQTFAPGQKTTMTPSSSSGAAPDGHDGGGQVATLVGHGRRKRWPCLRPGSSSALTLRSQA